MCRLIFLQFRTAKGAGGDANYVTASGVLSFPDIYLRVANLGYFPGVFNPCQAHHVKNHIWVRTPVRGFIGCHQKIDPSHFYPANPFHDYIGDYTRSEENTSELQSLMRISYAVF